MERGEESGPLTVCLLCRLPCSKETVLQHFIDLGMKEVTPKCVAKLLGEEKGVD